MEKEKKLLKSVFGDLPTETRPVIKLEIVGV
jgi:hypothetical protein